MADVLERTAAEVYDAMEERWGNSDVYRAELQLIAEEVDLDPDLITRWDHPPGAVLAAVRAALSQPQESE